MPHDKDGNVIAVGDKVNVECVVTETQCGEEYCNLTVTTTAPMFPGDKPSCFVLNTKQVSKIAVALALGLAFWVWGLGSARADTTNGVTSPLPQFGGTAWKVVTDAAAFFKDNTNIYNADFATLEAGAIYSKGSYGAAADLQFPVSAQLSVGFAVAYLDKNFYDGALTARIGTTWNVPVLGPVYTFAESGPGYNLSTGQVIAHNFTGVLWKRQVASKWQITLGGGAGYFSDRPGAVIGAGASLTYKFR